MRKNTLLLILLLVVCSIGWDSNGGWDLGSIFVRTSKYGSSRITANYTALSSDSGKTISIYCPNTTCEVELPTAEVGMELTFISESLKGFAIDPAATDILQWSAPYPDAGDKLKSNDDTYSSITIFCTQKLYWTVKNIVGTFNDAGE